MGTIISEEKKDGITFQIMDWWEVKDNHEVHENYKLYIGDKESYVQFDFGNDLDNAGKVMEILLKTSVDICIK